MKITKIVVPAIFFLLFSLGLAIASSPAKIQQLDGSFTVENFPVGLGPRWLAFDGANVWLTNAFDNNTTKLRASDGANLGTFPVGTYPEGIICDGANIWVANRYDNTLTKLRAS